MAVRHLGGFDAGANIGLRFGSVALRPNDGNRRGPYPRVRLFADSRNQRGSNAEPLRSQ